jgi:hypothetical protein
VRIAPVARKISTIKERRSGDSCLFRRGNYISKGHKNKKKSILGLSPDEDCLCNCETKKDRRTAQEQNCLFRRRYKKTNVINMKSVLGSFGKDILFRNSGFSYNIERYISNDETYDKLS